MDNELLQQVMAEAADQPQVDPNAAPVIDPNALPTEGVDPNAPPVDPNAPPIPPVDPNAPPVDPNAPPAEVPPVQAPAQGPISVEDIMSGKVPAADDLQALLSLKDRLDPTTLKLIDVFQGGKESMRSVLSALSMDWENMPQKECLYHDFCNENSDMVDGEDEDSRRALFEEHMGRTYQGYDPEDSNLSKSNYEQKLMHKKAEAFRSGKVSSQKEMDWVDSKYEPLVAEGDPQLSPEEHAAMTAERQAAVDGFKGLSIELPDGESISLDLGEDPKEKEMLGEMALKPFDYLDSRYLKADGQGKETFQTDQFLRDQYTLKNLKSIILKAVAYGQGLGSGETVENIDEIMGRKKPDGKAVAKPSEVDPDQLLVDKLAGQGVRH